MKRYIIFVTLVMVSWLSYMIATDSFHLFQTYWPAALTMVFGSFIAGASSEGGGAVAFPVFTLILNIPPAVARNFSFACQSFGMVSASFLILDRKIPILKNVIAPISIAGALGFIIGQYTLVPLVHPALTKLFFVSLWLSFGIALWLINRNKNRFVSTEIKNLTQKDFIILSVFGAGGGAISSILGNGIDIFTFCLLTLYYKADEKVATPTSVILMSINTVIGFLWHLFVVNDFQDLAFNCLMVCIPIVIWFAPLGAYAITFMKRISIVWLLLLIIIAQFLGAIIILAPNLYQWFFVATVFLLGTLLFVVLSKAKRTI